MPFVPPSCGVKPCCVNFCISTVSSPPRLHASAMNISQLDDTFQWIDSEKNHQKPGILCRTLIFMTYKPFKGNNGLFAGNCRAMGSLGRSKHYVLSISMLRYFKMPLVDFSSGQWYLKTCFHLGVMYARPSLCLCMWLVGIINTLLNEVIINTLHCIFST